MKSRSILLLAALGLGTAPLRADDPAPAHVLTLDASGHPRTDLNLGGTHVTGTLDAARLPAGIGGAFLSGVNRPTGTDITALDHVPVTGIAPGEVRQMVFTSGLDGFEGGTDSATGYPFTYAAATYRLVATPGDAAGDRSTSVPDTIPTPTAGKVWRLVSAALSNGDVVLPNGSVLGLGSTISTGQGGGSIDLSHGGGSIDLSHGGGNITLATGAVLTLGADSSVAATDSSYLHVGPAGSIDTAAGGSITTAAGGYIATGDSAHIDTTAGGSITTNGGSISVTASLTTWGNATITTNGNGAISTGENAPITTNGNGAITTGESAPITTGGDNGYIATGGGGYVDTTGGSSVMLGGHGSPEFVVAAQVGSLYTDQDGGAGAVLYVKESGGNSSFGWVAK